MSPNLDETVDPAEKLAYGIFYWYNQGACLRISFSILNWILEQLEMAKEVDTKYVSISQ